MSPQGKAAIVALLLVALFPSTASAIKGDVCRYGDKDGNLRPSEVRVFVMHQQSEVYRKYDVNCDGRLSRAELARYEADQQPLIDQANLALTLAKQDGKGVHVDEKGDTAEALFGSTEPAPVSPSSNWFFYLRDSAEEIGVFKEPKPFTSATGASFSASRDGVIKNTSWAAKGVAGLAYTWRNTERPAVAGTPYIAGISMSTWMSFNWLSNSAPALKSKQSDVLSFGTTEEFALANVLGATQYLRVKGAYNTDFESSPHSWATTLEWQPVSNRYKLSAPFDIGSYLVGRVDPIARFVHTERQSGGAMDPIFSQHNSVSRVGPVLSLTIQPKASDLILPNWLQSAVLNVTYEWLQDIDTRQKYELVNASMAFPIDSAGHLAFKLNYQKGRLEETGAKIDQAMVGLSAKW
jgi:hypothetical protein